jgi:hypothetical protein
MILLFLFAFLLKSSFLLSAATTGAACDPVLAIDPLEQRSRFALALETIKATVEGRIRFNQAILDMLKDEKTPIEERLLEYWKNQGSSEEAIRRKFAPINLNEFLARTISGVFDEIQTLTVTKLICLLSEKERCDSLKSGFLLALNIYSSIATLKGHESELSGAEKQHLDSSNYSELPHYKKMLKLLKKTNLPDLYDLMDGMFVRDSNKELQCSYSPSNILEKISNKFSQLDKQVKKYYKNALTEHNDEFQEYQTAIADYSKSYKEIWTKFSQIVVIAKKIQVSWQNFGSLNPNSGLHG